MKTISTETITNEVFAMIKKANYTLPSDVVNRFIVMEKEEKSPLCKDILGQIIENAQLASELDSPLCQDTGVAVIFVEIGQDVHIKGGSLEKAINDGVAKAYVEGYLRKSMVAEPVFERKNTQNNTPAVIHYSIVEGDSLHILFGPKGAGSENKSALRMFVPADGIKAIRAFVLDTVEKAGANACPPIVVGVGIGGDLEKCAILAKKALFRTVGKHNEDLLYAQLEQELYDMLQKTGIGAAGLGGSETVIAVNIEWFPCHIASLPVAIAINCHSARHAEITL